MLYRILLITLLIIAAHSRLYAQANCSTPPNCILNPGTDPMGTIGNTITAMPDWSMFMGTPIYGPGMGMSTGIQMVSDPGSTGEGVFACYNFQSGRKYRICFWARNTNTVSGGSLILQAHNGAAASQFIRNTTFYNNSGYAEFTETFTATQNFNQLRIYTNHTPGSGYSVVIDDIGITEIPTLTASPSSILGCGSVTLTASSSNPLDITWSPSTDLSSPTGSTVIATPCRTTIYTATYSNIGCTDYNNCTQTEQITIVVQPGSIDDSSSSVCGGKIDLRYNGICSNATYKWTGPKNPNSVLSTKPNLLLPTTTPGDMGSYRLIVTRPNGCADTQYASVVMNCCDMRADFNIVGINPVRFENNSTFNGIPALQGGWHWTFGDGTSSVVRSPAHKYAPMATYEVCLTAVVPDGLSSCCDKICKKFYIPDVLACQPKAAFDYRVVNPGTGAVQFLDKSAVTGTACGWIWKVNGVVKSTAQNPTIVVGPPNTYHVCLQVTNCITPGGPCIEEWCEDIVIP